MALSAENLGIGSSILALGWGIAGVLLKMPQEAILGGIATVGAVDVAATVKAKFEARRERRRKGGNSK